jgi:hypothetical protein
MPLIPGALYNFKYNTPYDDPNIIHKGTFLKENKYPGFGGKYWVFQLNRSTQTSLSSKYVTYMIDTSPALAKQVARGLCDRIPEDCAGIIERMLVGDTIMGKGLDRYSERS